MIGRTRKSSFQLMSTIAGIDEVSVWIDEARNNATAASIDARRARKHVYVLRERCSRPDVDDDPLMRGDHGPVDRRNLPLREPAARRGPGAGGNSSSVLNEEVGWLHGRP